jgi:hypothetical protein
MGRRNTEGDPDVAHRLYLHPLPFIDGDYDAGGAYWGAGSDGEAIWRAVEDDGDVELFFRATNRAMALVAVLDEYPLAVILPTPREGWFDDFVEGYVTAALWSSTDVVDGEDVELDKYELADTTREKMRAECSEFADAHGEKIAEAASVNGYTAERAGHDFWMTRARTGVGYFDRQELPEELREYLDKAAEAAGERDLYLGDDELVYQS